MHMSLVCYNCFMDPITLIFLLLLALLSLIYMLRSKLMSVLALLIKISFPVCAAIMLSALFIPQLFSTIADSALKANGTYQSIIEADKSLDSIINLLQIFLIVSETYLEIIALQIKVQKAFWNKEFIRD
ncbi:MAG: hypothetical protein UZ20_WS6002000953 [candidate division WS6 bacterium OLB21]|uniref:Uncharacterized protein n=1 Tax=candidate division WS6 bacterium OLB21 TaxID=1617427 RepID=A0A136KG89_9BACT|nr:MAG: hypothetical protein UZ20_WS6002000953 [candidate division WS6 bacterium OLB21]